MRFSHALRSSVPITLALIGAFCLCAQESSTPNQDVRPKDAPGLPPRVSPSEYQAQAHAGAITIGAEFVRHSVPTEQQTLSTEDYVVVDVGLFGPPETRLQITMEDFSLRINGKKEKSLPSQPFVLVLHSLKDPEWVAPESKEAKASKTSVGGNGQQEPSSPPPVIHVPIELQRAMAQHTQKAALPLGDRVLPQAGLLFFQYRGKAQKIHSVELTYSGAAGKATVMLRP